MRPRSTMKAARAAALAVAIAALGATLAWPAASQAASGSLIIKSNETHKHWDLALLLHGIWWGGIGTGIRFGIPIVPDGVATLNDQVKIEFGASFQNWWTNNICHHDPVDHPECRDAFFRLAFPVLLRWDFFLTKIVSVYGAVGVEIGVVLDKEFREEYHEYYYGWALFAAAFGINVFFHERVALRAEFCQSGFNVGVEFKL